MNAHRAPVTSFHNIAMRALQSHVCTKRTSEQTCNLQASVRTSPSPLPYFCVEPQMLMITSGPPGGIPPMGMPPGGIPPGVMPPGGIPPGVMPPGGMPPGGMPPGVMPGQFPPQAYPQQPGFY